MIIVNGYIRRKHKDGGGIDPTTGFPITQKNLRIIATDPLPVCPDGAESASHING